MVIDPAFGSHSIQALLTHLWVGRPGSEGRWPPRESIARAMRASGDLNPKAIRVSRRILVLVLSIRPLDRPCSIAARIDALC
jgi:hypothetical protein